MLFLALLAPLLQFTAAAPVTDAAVSVPNGSLLERRAGDGVHLVNCDAFGGEGTTWPSRSYVVYCPDDSNCNHFPTSDNICTMTTNSLFHWEGAAQACTFSTGTRFAWFVNANAQSGPNFVHVGDGGNQFKAFAGFKDDKHVMFSQGASQCHSIYYFI